MFDDVKQNLKAKPVYVIKKEKSIQLHTINSWKILCNIFSIGGGGMLALILVRAPTWFCAKLLPLTNRHFLEGKVSDMNQGSALILNAL